MANGIQLEVNHNNRRIRFSWRVSPRAKRYRVLVGPAGVEVVTPEGVRQADAERFLRLHADWVLAQQDRVAKLEQRRRPSKAAMASLPEGFILVGGEPARVEVLEDGESGSRVKIVKGQQSFRIHIPEGQTQAAEAALETYMIKLAKKVLPARVAVLAEAKKRKPERISIRSQKSRWGSCSSRGTLSFNWRLVMVPPEVLDYVILHELVHLEVPNHSPRFWEAVAAQDPEFKAHRRWLRENQAFLYDPLIG